MAAARLTLVVVLPTPPFWFISAMTRVGLSALPGMPRVYGQIRASRGAGGPGDQALAGSGSRACSAGAPLSAAPGSEASISSRDCFSMVALRAILIA